MAFVPLPPPLSLRWTRAAAGADLDQPNPRDGWTPVFTAARNGHADALRALAESGADLDETEVWLPKVEAPILRGVRPLTDIAAEFTMMMANRALNDELETVFLMADGEYAHVSSSLIKQVTPLATDEQLARFVPSEIIPDLRKKLTS